MDAGMTFEDEAGNTFWEQGKYAGRSFLESLADKEYTMMYVREAAGATQSPQTRDVDQWNYVEFLRRHSNTLRACHK